MAATIHAYSIEGIDGETIDFSTFKGKKILAVNVASECGLTPQYIQLQGLYEQFADQLVVVGFPSNDFAGQEPGSDKQIQAFCSKNYGVTFPLTTKIKVKGEDKHPIYQFLTEKAQNEKADTAVSWNFQKYILDEEGRLLAMFPPQTEPLDDRLLRSLELDL